MRIEEIRFCNLNSLVGEWGVDFTHPDYAAEGLFAITGPTGAGKSTILDAICLALYGRTPRLGAVSAACNEIMSRQTGFCRAEVTFSTPRGRFRCAWHQKRARNRPEGALQPIERRFVRADTGEVLEERIKKVNEAVEASTGMDFDRFTRSVMLAQGGFAAFLLAGSEQRSRVLESLTGTAIYRDISKHVYARYTAETRKFDILKSRLGGIELLSQEDVVRLHADLKRKREQQAVSRTELGVVEKGLRWLGGLELLRVEIVRLEAQKAAVLEQHAAFEPQRRKVRRAEKAQTLRPDFTELSLVNKAQTEAQLRLTQGNAAMPALEQRAASAEQQHTAAVNLAVSARNLHEAALPSLREAGKLDVQLAEKDARLRAEEKALAEAEKARTSLQTGYDARLKEGETVRVSLADLHQQMTTHAVDKALVDSLAGLEERFVHVRRLHSQLQSGCGAEKKARASGVLAETSLAAQTGVVAALQKVEAEARTRLDTRQVAICERLQGRELAAWREEMTRLIEARNHLLAAQDVRCRRAAAAAKLLDVQAVAKTLETRRQSRTVDITEREARLKAQLAESATLEKAVDRFRTMDSLAEHRAHLQDGAECPLCGALHHPFAEDAMPASDGLPERLNVARAACERGRRELEALHIQQAEDGKVLQENAARQVELAALTVELDSRLAQIAGGLAGGRDTPSTQALDTPQDLTARLAETETALVAVNTLLSGVEVDEKTLPSLRNALQAAADKVVKAQLAHASHTQALAASRNDCTRLATENAALSASLQNLLHTLEAEVLPFGEEAVTLELLDAVLNRLRTRRERWQGFTARDVALQQQAAALDAQLAQEAVRLSGEAQQLQTRRELVQALSAARQALHEQRLRCFAGEDPLKEEALLANRMAESEKQLKVTETALINARQALSAQQAELARLRIDTAERAAQLQALQAAFIAHLQTADFADQADFVAACLPESEFLRLTTEERRLDDALTGLEANLTRLTAQYVEQQGTQQTVVALPELEAEQKRLQDAIALLHSELGALEQSRKADADARIRHAELLDAIAQQQAVTTRWVELNRLIGSSEGQTYSRFAQGITFEIMLDHANRQLQVMKDRYLLVRDADEPLALNVIDSFQAGEIRPTTNLSGGESFLVSLALALGLSRMASQNVRVDSLFLDEGFGSLDEDALETALGTISSLREEGKLIGIISHVPAIKERVSTQILVTPVAGGKSHLQGPGVNAG